jgi:hypothetical protein
MTGNDVNDAPALALGLDPADPDVMQQPHTQGSGVITREIRSLPFLGGPHGWYL